VLSTPPAFILSQDQTLHLNLFHRPGPKSEPVEEEPNLLSRKQETLLFSKSRKKTSGTLYSVFKEPDPGFRPRTRRPTGATTRQLSSEDGNFRIRIFGGRVNEKPALDAPEKARAASRPAWKELETLSGGRAI
jgi:hypothetical protein